MDTEAENVELKAKIVELEVVRAKFDAIWKLINDESQGGFHEFIYWREESVKDELARVGFEGCHCE